MGVQDTCGVNNLHGMPGIFSGILSIIFAALATKDAYGLELQNIFKAMGGVSFLYFGVDNRFFYNLYGVLSL